jgi:hypothetical protein
VGVIDPLSLTCASAGRARPTWPMSLLCSQTRCADMTLRRPARELERPRDGSTSVTCFTVMLGQQHQRSGAGSFGGLTPPQASDPTGRRRTRSVIGRCWRQIVASRSRRSAHGRLLTGPLAAQLSPSSCIAPAGWCRER